MNSSNSKTKWVTRLNREKERKVYFYLALIMSALWFLAKFAQT